jgi:hypothetical protein
LLPASQVNGRRPSGISPRPCTFWWEDECVLAGLAEGIAEEPERARLFLALREKLAAAEAEGSLSALPGF